MKLFMDIWSAFMISVTFIGFSVIGYLCCKLDKQMWNNFKNKQKAINKKYDTSKNIRSHLRVAGYEL